MITDLDELGALLDGRRTLFRLETLDVYEVASDGSDYRRYPTLRRHAMLRPVMLLGRLPLRSSHGGRLGRNTIAVPGTG